MEGKNVSKSVHVHDQTFKQELASCSSVIQYAYENGTYFFKGVLYKRDFQNSNRNQYLKGKANPNSFPIDGFSIGTEQERNQDQNCHPQCATQQSA